MEKVVVCYKWVLDEADVRIGDDGSVDLSRAKGKISEYDRNAIAEACDLASLLDEGEAVGVTFGASPSKASLKDALSRGLSQAYWVKGESASQADGFITATCLAEAVRCIEGANIVVCAEGASDTFARQTAPRIAALLGIPVVTSVMEAAVGDGKIIAKRRLEDCIETVEVPFPVVLGVLPEIIQAPIPGLKAIMAASKKPVTEFSADEFTDGKRPLCKVAGVKGSTVDRACVRIEEDDPKATAAAFVAALRREGVL